MHRFARPKLGETFTAAESVCAARLIPVNGNIPSDPTVRKSRRRRPSHKRVDVVGM
jgi:hypothetical protein